MQIAQKNFYKKFFGKVGEDKAVKYLKKQGYTILEKNFKTHIGEIDVIAMDKSAIVFVEVKTRIDDSYGAPSEAVDSKKQAKYIKVATEYLQRHKKLDSECRFDVVEIQNGEINHIINAFCG